MTLPIEDYALIATRRQRRSSGSTGRSTGCACPVRLGGVLRSFARHARARALAHRPQTRQRATRRSYRAGSLVLTTEWELKGGTVRVTDFMPPRTETPDLIRIVEGVRGSVNMRAELTLRFDYGRLVPWVRRVGGDLCAVSGPDAVCLRTSVPVYGEGLHTAADFTVKEGETVSSPELVPSHLAPTEPPHAGGALSARDVVARWCARLALHRRLEGRGQAVADGLEGDDMGPTGGIVAAPTTSLPEEMAASQLGLPLCWVRDAAFSCGP